MSVTCFRDSQTSFTAYQTPYQSGVHDTHSIFNMSTSMIWSPFQAPTSADQTQKIWCNDGKVEVSRKASNWKAKRVTVVATPAPLHALQLQTTPCIEFMNDPPSIHLELSDCSICTPIFDDHEI